MLAFIKIGPMELKLEDASEQWIIQTFRHEQATHGTVCVQFRFDLPGLRVILSTCPTGLGGKADWTRDEQRVIDLWKKLGLDTPPVTQGQVIAFTKQVVNMLGIAA